MQPIKDVLRGDILLTGVTGFVGVVTLAKLLRHAPHSRVFVLVRPGNKIGARTRFETVCEQNGILFMGLDIARVHVVSGDMTACDKISAEDVATLHNVTTAIHCAASTEWRSPLPELLKINVHGAVALFTFCLTHLPKLRSYVHTSTSYSCTISSGAGCNPESVSVGNGQPRFSAESFPNGYTYSKYLAEVIIAEQVAKVPNCRVKVSIVRPAIVTNALGFDYVPRGWGMDMRGVNAAFLCYKALRGKPLTSVVPYNGTYEMHCIPVDVVANILIAAAARGHELSVSALPAKPMTALANKEHGIKCVPFTDRSDMDMSCTTLEMTPVSKHGSVQSTVGSVKGPDAHQLTSRPQPFARPRPGIPSPYRNKHSHVDCTQHSAEEAAELRARNTPDNSHTAMILSHLVTSATTPVAQRKAAPTIPERPTGYTAEKVNALLNLQPALTLKPTTSVASNTSCNTESSIDMVMDDAPRMARFPQRSQARGRNHRHSLQLCYENTDIEYSTSATVSSASDIVTNNSPGLVGSSGVSVDEYGSGNNTVVVYNAAPGPNTQTAEAFFKSFVPQKLIFTEDRAEFKKQLRMRTEILANLVGRRKGFRKLKDALLIFSCFGHSRFSFPIENVQHLHNLLHESDRKNFSLLCTDIDYVAYTQSCCGTVERMVKYRQQGKKSHR